MKTSTQPNKTKSFPWWALLSGALVAAALILRYVLGYYGELPFILGFIAVGIGLWHFRRNRALLLGGVVAFAVFLRFVLRGYGWWAYTLLFITALCLLHHYLPAFWWRIVIILTCIGLVYFAFVESFVIRSARTDKEAQRDYLIVLGAAVNGNDPSLTLIRRLQGALDYLETYPESVAIVSGGMGPGENITEAQAMFDWLCRQGVDSSRIIMEPQATSTEENLRYSFDIIRARGDEPQGHVAIVSSAYHLYRAKTMAQHLGVTDAAGVAAPWGYFFVMLNYFIREAFGVTKLWVLGH